MANIKRGTYALLPVKIELASWEGLDKIEFLFKQYPAESAPVLKSVVYTPSGEILRVENTVYIPWSRADTYLFADGRKFYMDTRITFTDSEENPNTGAPVPLTMTPTLFKEGEEL